MQEKDEFLRKKIGLRIRQLRIEKNLSQEAFADQVGIHRTYMGNIERGEKNITIVTAKKIAVALGITISDLLNGL